jgi:hypothetical protein
VNGTLRGAEFENDDKARQHATAALGVARTHDVKVIGALALARAGGAPKARTAYQDFFALSEDADPDILILIAAKAEYAKLP